eukprot:753038-Hanusia_phi.AAC.1
MSACVDDCRVTALPVQPSGSPTMCVVLLLIDILLLELSPPDVTLADSASPSSSLPPFFFGTSAAHAMLPCSPTE